MQIYLKHIQQYVKKYYTLLILTHDANDLYRPLKSSLSRSMALSVVSFVQQTRVHLELHYSLTYIYNVLHIRQIEISKKIYSLCSGHRSGDALSSFSRLIKLSSTEDKSIRQIKFYIEMMINMTLNCYLINKIK